MKKTQATNRSESVGLTLQKAKFAKATQFAAKMKFLLCFIYRKPMQKVHPCHVIRYVIKHKKINEWPTLRIDYSEVLISCGDLKPVSLYAAVSEQGRTR